MNMFKPINASSVEDYLRQLNPDRRQIINQLITLITKTAPSLKMHLAYNMLGFGTFKYLDYKKRQVEWPVIGLGSQKNYVSIYICAVDGQQYLAEKYATQLGKVNVGKSCIRFNKIDNLNLDILKTIINQAASNPGLVKT